MIYFTCFFESVKFVEIFTSNNFKVEDGDGEFKCKIDVSDLNKFKSFVSELKSNNNQELLTLLEDSCYDFESTGEDILDSLEDDVLNIIKQVCQQNLQKRTDIQNNKWQRWRNKTDESEDAPN